MNFNFMLAGTASTNPLLFALAVLLLLAWRIAGNIGLERFLLPLLGTPWGRGREERPEPGRRSNGPRAKMALASPTASERAV